MTNPTVTEERRSAISTLIAQDAISVTFTRATAVSDSYGGYDYTESSITSQTFRLVRYPSPIEVATTGGRTISANGLLVCQYNADVEQGDRFTHEDWTYEVVGVREWDWMKEADLVVVDG